MATPNNHSIFIYHINVSISQPLFQPIKLHLIGNEYFKNENTISKKRVVINITGLRLIWSIYPADSDALEQVKNLFNVTDNSHSDIKIELTPADKLPIAFANNQEECMKEAHWLSVSCSTSSPILEFGNDLKQVLIKKTKYYSQIGSNKIRVFDPDKHKYDIWLRNICSTNSVTEDYPKFPGWINIPEPTSKSLIASNQLNYTIQEFKTKVKPLYNIAAPYLKFCWIDYQNKSCCITEDSRYVNLLYPGDERDIEAVKKKHNNLNTFKKSGIQIKKITSIDSLINKEDDTIQHSGDTLDKLRVLIGILDDVDIIIHVSTKYPVLTAPHEKIDILELQLEHVNGLWNIGYKGHEKLSAKWRQIMHVVVVQSPEESPQIVHEKTTIGTTVIDISSKQTFISNEFRESLMGGKNTILTSALFESRITNTPWQVTCDFVAHPSRKVQWFLLGLFCKYGYTILPSISIKNEDVNKNMDVSYAGGFNKIKHPGVYIPNTLNGFIAQLDVFGYYPTIIGEVNLCLTDSSENSPWNSYLKKKTGFNPMVMGSNNDMKLADIAAPIIEDLILKHKSVNYNRHATAVDINNKKLKCPLPNIVTELLNIRRYCKSIDKLGALALAIKNLLNSMYGSFSFKESRFFSPLMSAIIAGIGREWIKELSEISTKILNADTLLSITDCIVILVEKNIAEEKIIFPSEILRPFIDWIEKRFAILTIDTNTIFGSILIQKRNKYAALKKRYLSNKDINTISYIKDDLIIKHIESVRSDWCEWASSTINCLLLHILCGDTMEDIFSFMRKYDWHAHTGAVNNTLLQFSFSAGNANNRKIDISDAQSSVDKDNNKTYVGYLISIDDAESKISNGKYMWKLKQKLDTGIDENAWQYWYLGEQIFVPLATRIFPLCKDWKGIESAEKLALIMGYQNNRVIQSTKNANVMEAANNIRVVKNTHRTLKTMLLQKLNISTQNQDGDTTKIAAASLPSAPIWEAAIKCLTCNTVVPINKPLARSSSNGISNSNDSINSNQSKNNKSILTCQNCKNSLNGTIDLSNNQDDVMDVFGESNNKQNVSDMLATLTSSNSMNERIFIRKSQSFSPPMEDSNQPIDSSTTRANDYNKRIEYISNLNLVFDTSRTEHIGSLFKANEPNVDTEINSIEVISVRKAAVNITKLEYDIINL